MKNSPYLLLCILLDVLGYLTYLLPFFGEMGDVIWAPFSGWLFYKLFGGKLGVIGGVVSFMEEAIPGLDFVPSFTIGWVINYLAILNQK